MRLMWKNPAMRAAAIVALTLLAYLPALEAGFVWDDDDFLTNNPLIHAQDGLRRFWCTLEAPDYFPLTSTTLWMEWRLWGLHAAAGVLRSSIVGTTLFPLCLHFPLTSLFAPDHREAPPAWNVSPTITTTTGIPRSESSPRSLQGLAGRRKMLDGLHCAASKGNGLVVDRPCYY
jgi:hypothetical protein